MKINKETIRNAIKFCDFEILIEDKKCIDLGQYTPLGEDWFESFDWSSASKFIASLEERINNFDIDEEASIWIDLRGKNGVPDSIKGLVEDAEWKLGKLKDLLKEVTK